MMHPHEEKVVVRCDDAWAGSFELDTRWFHEWVDYGVGIIELHLRFEAWADARVAA